MVRFYEWDVIIHDMNECYAFHIDEIGLKVRTIWK